MTKNGLPPSFRVPVAPATRRAPDRNESESAINWPTSSRVSGARTISCTTSSRVSDRVQLAHQRMGGHDFVVPVGADQQQVSGHPAASTGLRADRAWPRRAIASRRGTAPVDAPAARTLTGIAGMTSWKRRRASWAASSRDRRLVAKNELQFRGPGPPSAVRSDPAPRGGRHASGPARLRSLPRSGRTRS